MLFNVDVTNYNSSQEYYIDDISIQVPIPVAPPKKELTISMRTTSTPSNGKYYTENETVNLVVEVKNTGNVAFAFGDERDVLAIPYTGDMFNINNILYAGETVEHSITGYVMNYDVLRGYIPIVAFISKDSKAFYDSNVDDDASYGTNDVIVKPCIINIPTGK
jgi:hypothetical protein